MKAVLIYKINLGQEKRGSNLSIALPQSVKETYEILKSGDSSEFKKFLQHQVVTSHACGNKLVSRETMSPRDGIDFRQIVDSNHSVTHKVTKRGFFQQVEFTHSKI